MYVWLSSHPRQKNIPRCFHVLPRCIKANVVCPFADGLWGRLSQIFRTDIPALRPDAAQIAVPVNVRHYRCATGLHIISHFVSVIDRVCVEQPVAPFAQIMLQKQGFHKQVLLLAHLCIVEEATTSWADMQQSLPEERRLDLHYHIFLMSRMGIFLSILFHNYQSGLIHFTSHQCFAWFKFLVFSRYLETCWVTSSFTSDNEMTWQEATQMEALHLLLGRLAWNRKIYTWTFAPLTTAKIQTLRKAIWSSTCLRQKVPCTSSSAAWPVWSCWASFFTPGFLQKSEEVAKRKRTQVRHTFAIRDEGVTVRLNHLTVWFARGVHWLFSAP